MFFLIENLPFIVGFMAEKYEFSDNPDYNVVKICMTENTYAKIIFLTRLFFFNIMVLINLKLGGLKNENKNNS